jgi:uncharacterized protein YciI
MGQFIYLLRPVRPGLALSPTPEEQAIVNEHFEYLKAKLEAGELFLAGRTTDENPLGIAVFEAESLEAAREFMIFDPAVKQGVMVAELHPYRIALMKKDS